MIYNYRGSKIEASSKEEAISKIVASDIPYENGLDISDKFSKYEKVLPNMLRLFSIIWCKKGIFFRLKDFTKKNSINSCFHTLGSYPENSKLDSILRSKAAFIMSGDCEITEEDIKNSEFKDFIKSKNYKLTGDIKKLIEDLIKSEIYNVGLRVNKKGTLVFDISSKVPYRFDGTVGLEDKQCSIYTFRKEEFISVLKDFKPFDNQLKHIK